MATHLLLIALAITSKRQCDEQKETFQLQSSIMSCGRHINLDAAIACPQVARDNRCKTVGCVCTALQTCWRLIFCFAACFSFNYRQYHLVDLCMLRMIFQSSGRKHTWSCMLPVLGLLSAFEALSRRAFLLGLSKQKPNKCVTCRPISAYLMASTAPFRGQASSMHLAAILGANWPLKGSSHQNHW